MRRTVLLALASGLSAAALLLPAAPVLAGAKQFNGVAPGTIRCTVTVSVRFHPALTNLGGGAKVVAKGAAKSCTPTQVGISVKTGKIKVAGPLFAKSSLNCGNPAPTSGSFSVYWLGAQFNGVYGGQTFANGAKFNPSDVSATGGQLTADGSGHAGLAFPGSGTSDVNQSFGALPPSGFTGSLFTTQTEAQLSALCAGKGISLLVLSGTLTF